MENTTGGRIMAEMLRAEGVEKIFGIIDLMPLPPQEEIQRRPVALTQSLKRFFGLRRLSFSRSNDLTPPSCRKGTNRNGPRFFT